MTRDSDVRCEYGGPPGCSFDPIVCARCTPLLRPITLAELEVRDPLPLFARAFAPRWPMTVRDRGRWPRRG